MAAVTPPSLEQIKQMRESIKDCSNYRVVVDMGETVFDSTMSFLIWDDNNQLLHAISANTANSNIVQQCDAPFRIDHVDYAQIEAIYSNMK